MIAVQVVGLGMSPDDLTPRALKVIREAQVLVGGRRLLSYFPDHPAQKIPLGKDVEGALGQLPALAADLRVVVLASGDPNFYGVGPLVLKLLGPEQVVVHPNITAVQAACARLKMAWQDASVVSLHGRSFQPLAASLSRGPDRVLVYTDPEHTPGAIARWLLARGQEEARLCVLEDLGQATERLTWLSPREALEQEFSPLNLVVILPGARQHPQAATPSEAGGLGHLHLGLPEEALARQGGLITKAEVRAVVLAKLALTPGLTLWDLGAGCGSVSLEASLLLPGGRIIAVEQDQDRAAQIRANRAKFGVTNLEVVLGRAPACLADLPVPQRVFIGGGGRDLGEILPAVLGRLEPGDGRVVLTATLLNTLERARGVLAAAGWQMEVTLLQVSRSRPLADGAYMQAQNPVWIVSGWAGDS
ncbi:MAG: precorrin-6y C5,15-methyltransferase (decarboxylating) subunit CbiE [Desulfobaccales bacterium]|jgi:precorrin-6Y C5,15-methyltransferase (decarboxylating)